MFDIGFWELTIILIVILLLVGPERLPSLARQAGLWIGKARRVVNNLRSDIEREIQAEELKHMVHQQQSEIEELKEIVKDTLGDEQADENLFDDSDVKPSSSHKASPNE